MEPLASLVFGMLATAGTANLAFFSPPLDPPPTPIDATGAPLRIPIFIYHSVATDTPRMTKTQADFDTDPQLLDEQLSYIEREGYTPVTMRQVADMLRRGTTSPIEKPVALTFDDGWVTQYRNAFPVLLAHHAVATFYVYPNPIGRDPRFMTWDELAELQSSGMEIAGHSYTHPLLSGLTDDELHRELYDSKRVLEERLGTPVTDFASPFGYTSPTVETELMRDGYETGRTTYAGMWHAATSTYALTGYLVHRSLSDFEWALERAK